MDKVLKPNKQKPHKPKIAISIGDINGVGLEIILREHKFIKSLCEPIYCAHKELFINAARILHLKLDDSMKFSLPESEIPQINIAKISKKSGIYSFKSFLQAIKLVDSKKTKAIVTLPIHKAAWKKANIPFAGHTQVLSKHYKKQAIMVLGNEKMLVGLYSDHTPLNDVSKLITTKKYTKFLLRLHSGLKFESALVLGFNPHCGDNGAIGGSEDKKIAKAIECANSKLNKKIFIGPVPPDTAFIPSLRKKFKVFIAPYHDIGLCALKALYFDSSVNISLNIPIIRTSVDHGVAFDIAYQGKCSTQSYKNAISMALHLIIDSKKLLIKSQTPKGS